MFKMPTVNDVSFEEEIGHLKLPKFIESSDQVLFLSNYLDMNIMEDSENGTERNVTTSLTVQDDIPTKILKQSGIMLQIIVNDSLTEAEPESLMHVYSICDYCGGTSKWHQRDLGYWQRNKTLFGKYFHVFDQFYKNSFNSTNLSIGYFNHKPHFSCYFDGVFNKQDIVKPGEVIMAVDNGTFESSDEPVTIQETVTTCEGVEWEMISQMAKSLDFTTTWVNLSNPELGEGHLGETSNISNMIDAFEAEKIDLGVGGISVTRKRTMYVDFSSVFANDPIGK